MSYSILIGDAEIEYLDLDLACDWYDGLPSHIRIVVRAMEHEDAPVFPGDYMTTNTNGRHPGYGQWSEFLEEVGLKDLFFEKYVGLMSEHPGTKGLKAKHLEAVREAIVRYKAAHPDWSTKALGWPKDDSWTPEGRAKWDAEAPNYDMILPRLIWLEWWMAWALTNCKHPAIYNH